MSAKQCIVAGWLIDGSGEKVRRNVCIEQEAGRIIASSSCGVSSLSAADRVADLSHCTILPPLVDCCVNLTSSAATDYRLRKEDGEEDGKKTIKRIAQNIHYCSSHGVIGIGDSYIERHVDLMSKDLGAAEYDNVIIKETVSVAAQSGIVELAGSGGSKVFHGIANGAKKTPDIQTWHNMIIDAGKGARKVIAVANGSDQVKAALQAGCHAIAQGCFMGHENLRQMAECGTIWLPMMVQLKNVLEKSSLTGKVWRNVEKRQLEQLTLAREFGVVVALGTGAGEPGILHGESMVEEMKYLRKAGYLLEETIRCATLNGAEFLEIGEIQELRQGGIANFIVSRGTPSQLPRKLSYLEAIFRNGSQCASYRKNPVKTVYPDNRGAR